MPFLEADPTSIVFNTPTLHMRDSLLTPDSPVVGWDYLTPVTVTCAAEYDEELIRASTGIEDLASIGAYLQVDCLATRWRTVVTTPLTAGAQALSLRIDLDPGFLSDELELRHGLVLLHENPATTSQFAARSKGSRLLESAQTHRFVLEGDGSAFPVEAFPFSTVNLPKSAPWHLHCSAGNLDDSFKGHVRLFVNTEHPHAAQILSGSDPVMNSIVTHGVFVDLLLKASQLDSFDDFVEYEEGGIGDTLDELTELQLAQPLAEAVRGLRQDPLETMTRLRSELGLLGG